MQRINLSGNIKRYTFLAAVFALVITAGCNQSLDLKVESEVPIPLVSKLPVNMGVYYEDTFRNHVYTENSETRPNWSIESGPSQVALFDQVLPSMFRSVKHLESLPAASPDPEVNAILVPEIEEMQFSLPRETRLDMYEVWIKYKLKLLENDGELIAELPLTAYGKTTTEFLKNREEGLNGAMEIALRDAGAKMAIGFPQSEPVRQWLTSHIPECTGEPGAAC